MKRNIVICLLVALVVFNLMSCTPKPDEIAKPDNLIARDTLVAMFYDIHMIDAVLSTGVLPAKGQYSRYNLYQSMFVKYHRDEDDFNETIRYYVLTDISKLYDMYDEVLSRLNMEQGELTKKLQEEL